MDHISMDKWCYNSTSEGWDISSFLPYLQAKSLFIRKGFDECIDVGRRSTSFEKIFMLWKKTNVSFSLGEKIEKWISMLPNGIQGKMLFSVTSDGRYSGVFSATLYEDAKLKIIVSDDYVRYLIDNVNKLEKRLLDIHISILEDLSNSILYSDSLYFTVSDKGLHNTDPFISFESLGMKDLSEYWQEYAFASTLVEYINSKNNNEKYELSNRSSFSTWTNIQKKDNMQKKLLKDW